MKSRQTLVMLCALICSACLADNGNPPSADVEFLWPFPLNAFQQFWNAFLNFAANNNFPGSSNSGCAPTPVSASTTNSSSDSTTNSSNDSTTISPESTSGERSKIKSHPAARHSHKEVKNHHLHAKKHGENEKNGKHERHQGHQKAKHDN